MGLGVSAGLRASRAAREMARAVGTEETRAETGRGVPHSETPGRRTETTRGNQEAREAGGKQGSAIAGWTPSQTASGVECCGEGPWQQD